MSEYRNDPDYGRDDIEASDDEIEREQRRERIEELIKQIRALSDAVSAAYEREQPLVITDELADAATLLWDMDQHDEVLAAVEAHVEALERRTSRLLADAIRTLEVPR